jgi:hypothetical protein
MAHFGMFVVRSITKQVPNIMQQSGDDQVWRGILRLSQMRRLERVVQL